MLLKITWEEFKSVCLTEKKLSGQYTTKDGVYNLLAFDGPLTYNCVPTSVEDIEDFESQIALFNKVIDVRDTHTGKLVTKTEPYNGPLYVPFCRFKTGLGSGDSSWEPPPSNASNNFWSIDVSSPGYTKVSFLPNFNYQIDGIGYQVLSTPEAKVTMHQVILAPTVAAPTGSYVFTEGKLLTQDSLYERHTSPKYLKNYGIIEGVQTRYHEIMFVVKHEETENLWLQVSLSIYPQ